MNEQIKNTLDQYQIPELVIHGTPESIFDAHWNFEKDLTFEELLASECGGADDEPAGTLKELFEATRDNGFWGFTSVPENKIHLWFAERPDLETLLLLIGHELGHIFEEKLEKEGLSDEEKEYFRHEENSDLFGIACVFANRLANQYLQAQFAKVGPEQ